MRLEKQSIINDLRTRMQKAQFVILADYKGLDVAAMNDLRGRLRGAAAEFHVVQNSLVRLVAKDLGQSGLEPGLTGPSAMISGSGDVALAAKVLRDRHMAMLDRRHPGYAFAQNKGYGTHDHVTALLRQGPCAEHRRSFRPVQDALQILPGLLPDAG